VSKNKDVKMVESRKVLNNKIIVLVVLGLIILLPLVYNVVLCAYTNSPESFLEKPKGDGKCVRDAEYMRSNHMVLLKGIRNQAMREGKKTEIGLKNCRQCHTNREQFCDRCHTKVNLKPDCFSCHYYPAIGEAKKND